jgi:hypothetical protein
MKMTKVRRALVVTAASAIGAMSAMAGSMSTDQQSTTVKVQELNPFTHFALIPAGSELSTIRFEGVRRVAIATRMKSWLDGRYCEEAARRDSGDSMRCPYTEFQAPSPAYAVTYSYHGQPLASDEYGSSYFTFSVYLREDELSPAMRKKLSEHKSIKAAAEDFFALTTSRDTVQSAIVDEAASTFCQGNFVDGAWMRTDRNCVDKVSTTTMTAPAKYITVRVDSVLTDSASSKTK